MNESAINQYFKQVIALLCGQCIYFPMYMRNKSRSAAQKNYLNTYWVLSLGLQKHI